MMGEGEGGFACVYIQFVLIDIHENIVRCITNPYTYEPWSYAKINTQY